MKINRQVKIQLFLFILFSFLNGVAQSYSKSKVIDVNNKHQLQRGARLFMNYCSGCHSLQYMRYNKMAEDIGLVNSEGQVDEVLLKENLIFTDSSISDVVNSALLPSDAKQWFGVTPPDLSLTGKEKGANWIYSYLNGFYPDSTQFFGVNNRLIPNTVMPDCLSSLAVDLNHSSRTQLESDIADITTFLVYVSDPSLLVRYRLGGYVIAFLTLFFIIVYFLKRNYWQAVRKRRS